MQRQPPIFKRTVIVGPDTKLFRSVEVLRCGALAEEHVAPPELARDGALRNLLQGSVVELGEELGATDEIDVDHADVDSSGASVTIFTGRSDEHPSELQSLMRISYAVFCLKKKTHTRIKHPTP